MCINAYSYTLPGTEPTGTCTTTSLSYSDTTNPDRLTSYGSKAITYNTNGGVASYDGWDYTWNKGKLSRISKTLGTRAIKPSFSPSKSYTFNYNGQGQRISAGYSYFSGFSDISLVQSGEVISYTKQFKYDNSGRLIEEVINGEKYQDGSFSKTLRYLYDASDVVGVQYTQGANINAYYFQRNLQGDVVAIYDTTGNKVVEYSYDAWGNCTIESATTNYDLAHANPIRYRGYYYDEATKLYYLNARYYSPEFRRFISPDDTAYLDPENVNGLNLYAYCCNDPVNYADPSGHAPKWLQGLAIGLAIVGAVLVVGAVTVLTCGVGTLAGTLAGAVIYGAAQGITIGAAVGVVGGGIVGGIASDWSAEGILIGMGIGLGAGAIVGGVIGGFAGYTAFPGHSVYISKADGTVNYVGRTNNIARRTLEHANAGRGVVPQEVAKKLTLKQARGLEQALINKYKMIKNGGTLINRINSIATSNPIYSEAVAWGNRYIARHFWCFL